MYILLSYLDADNCKLFTMIIDIADIYFLKIDCEEKVNLYFLLTF